jgi:hypothetical protein
MTSIDMVQIRVSVTNLDTNSSANSTAKVWNCLKNPEVGQI